MSASTTPIVQWMIDTRKLWPVDERAPAKEQMLEFRKVVTLDFLTAEEQQAVLKYYHVKDAKMTLASYLLKHLAITRLCGVPWSNSTLSRGTNGKPCYTPESPEGKSIDFNVSHQAGIVTLVACSEGRADLGTDIVCVNERDDYARIEKDGFFSWVDMHADVFAPSETQALKMDTTQLGLPGNLRLTGYGRDVIARCQHRNQQLEWKDATGQSSEIDSNTIIDAKFRRFYALWCLREAYVKMTSEALLADWLQELEFRTFKTPSAAREASHDESALVLGEVVTAFGIYFKGKKVEGVAMELRAFGRDYMVASAARLGSGKVSDVSFNGFTDVQLEADIYATAEAENTRP